MVQKNTRMGRLERVYLPRTYRSADPINDAGIGWRWLLVAAFSTRKSHAAVIGACNFMIEKG